MQDINERISKLKVAVKTYQDDRDRTFETKASTEQQKDLVVPIASPQESK